jgi:hypothetical protein
MSKEKTDLKKAESICSIKGMRSAVFKKAHDKAKEYELEGKILMPNDWKEMLSEAWVEVTDDIAKTCNQSGASEEKESTEIQSVEQAEQEPTASEDLSSDEVPEEIPKDDINA